MRGLLVLSSSIVEQSREPSITHWWVSSLTCPFPTRGEPATVGSQYQNLKSVSSELQSPLGATAEGLLSVEI
jgi:hypothetical protein